MNRTIAVTGISSGENIQPGLPVLRSLRRIFPHITGIGLAYEHWDSGLYASDEFDTGGIDAGYHVPKPSDGRFALLSRIDQILTEHAIDIFVPTLDSELLNVVRLGDELADRGIATCLPTEEALLATRKESLSQLAKECDVPVPTSVAVSVANAAVNAAAAIGYPVMVKGPFCGADRVWTQAELLSRFHAVIGKWGGPVMIQQCLDGGELNVMGLGDGQGNLPGWCMMRKTVITETGKGYGGVAIRDDRLLEIAERVVRHLDWRGPLELEFKEDADGEPHLIEINPRFPAWCDFPSTFGHNLPHLLVEALETGEMNPLPHYDPGAFFVRHTVEVTGHVSDVGIFQTSGALHRQPNGWTGASR